MQLKRLLLLGLALIAPSALADAPPPKTATVAAVYDGDTLTLETGDKVRLRGVNAPELKPAEDYGIEARDAAATLVLNHEVALAYGAVQRDGYGRLLASVRVDGADLAESLLEQGLGHLFIIPPDELDLTTLIAAQTAARAAKRGIWSTPRYQGDLHITSFHANADGDDRANVNGEYIRVCNISARPVDLQGFWLRDLSGRTWTLPAVIVPIGHTVQVHSGQGEDQLDPTQQLAIYLDSDQPVWNNTRDRVTIYDRYGQVVDARDHSPENPGRQ